MQIACIYVSMWIPNVNAMQCNAKQNIQHFSNSIEAFIVGGYNEQHSTAQRTRQKRASKHELSRSREWNVLSIVWNWNLRMNTFHMSTNNSWKWEDFLWMRTMAQWQAHVFFIPYCVAVNIPEMIVIERDSLDLFSLFLLNGSWTLFACRMENRCILMPW